jgi:hypothetical protein
MIARSQNINMSIKSTQKFARDPIREGEAKGHTTGLKMMCE